MNTGNVPQFVTRLNSLILVGAFIILAAAVAVPFYATRSSSLPTRGNSQPSANSGASARLGVPASGPAVLGPWSSIFMPLLPVPQPSPESIATYDGATCVTPTTDFQINTVVCARATGVPPTLFPWHVAWIDPAGSIQQLDVAST